MAITHPAAPAQATRGSGRTWWMATWRIVLLGLAVIGIAMAMWPRGAEATLDELVDDLRPAPPPLNAGLLGLRRVRTHRRG